MLFKIYCIFFPVDITVYYNGFHGDLNETFFVGNVDERSKKLVRVSYECLDLAIKEGMMCAQTNAIYALYSNSLRNFNKFFSLKKYFVTPP